MSGKIGNIKRKREQGDDDGNYSKRLLKEDSKSDGSSTETELNTDPQNNNRKMDFLKAALDKVTKLEQELASLDYDEYDSEDSGHDGNGDELSTNQYSLTFEAEALGFAVCARETLSYLMSAGLSPNDPLMRSLRKRLVGKCHGIPI